MLQQQIGLNRHHKNRSTSISIPAFNGILGMPLYTRYDTEIANQSQRIPTESHSSQTYLPKRYIMSCHVCPWSLEHWSGDATGYQHNFDGNLFLFKKLSDSKYYCCAGCYGHKGHYMWHSFHSNTKFCRSCGRRKPVNKWFSVKEAHLRHRRTPLRSKTNAANICRINT